MKTSTPSDDTNQLTVEAERPEATERSAWAMHRFGADRYYAELIRIITGLFVGVLALMTFLLTVGVQRPHAGFSWALYASIGLLALNLIAYVFGHLFRAECDTRHWAMKSATGDDKDSAELKEAWQRTRKRLKAVRLVQQILFVAAVVAVTCLALVAANFFFTLAPAASGAPAQ